MGRRSKGVGVTICMGGEDSLNVFTTLPTFTKEDAEMIALVRQKSAPQGEGQDT